MIHSMATMGSIGLKGNCGHSLAKDIPATIAELDEIEETNQPGVCNLYDHVMVRAFDAPNSHHSELALVYQYSCDDRLAHSRRLRPADGESSVAWPAASGKP
jgi:hypothetical protein